MRTAGPTTLIVPALFVALTTVSAHADVEVDLTAIGGRTEADARIAPGKQPVQLRYPGQTPPTRILLTPPASVRQSQELPKVLGPVDATAVEVQPTAATPATPVLSPVPTPITRTAAPAPQSIKPRPVTPVEQTMQAPVASSNTLAPLPSPASTVQSTVPNPPVSAPKSTPAQTIQVPPVQEPPVQIASLPAPQSASHRLRFEGNTPDILGAARDELEMVAVELMRHDDRIEIQAFAGAAGDVSSDARRLSLKRALNVRKFLVERGVLQSRIDVRALGGTRDSGPTDRVDILLSSR
ncbi:OmpA family protein [Parvibaculaceae bacterium PLY_AMNH_Bact1]|nr:OmpA family protein [Parvibaculaceae bacterium PLY_AMNH_Bact1]